MRSTDHRRGVEDWQGGPDGHPTPDDAGTPSRHPEARRPEARRPEARHGEQSTADERTAAIPTRRDGVFTAQEADGYRDRWHRVQGAFVDNPSVAVEEADKLVVDAIRTLSEHKRSLERWREGAETEELRQALQGYRSFLDRLLKV
ncbi:hypothetical protein [Actinokineospora fastidiosa]|uniref:Uncharacterized protein n=1 Tax=Actinokineospora fastidiosa TaxID=1816 RepID=A0A918LBX3_9PSEU|nr:hypothetical protein [Actinokineospora fastidiosa]GGS27668.1 hypothetical protein GCM10010171_20550 [Actinokineospora fastidiosa]